MAERIRTGDDGDIYGGEPVTNRDYEVEKGSDFEASSSDDDEDDLDEQELTTLDADSIELQLVNYLLEVDNRAGPLSSEKSDVFASSAKLVQGGSRSTCATLVVLGTRLQPKLLRDLELVKLRLDIKWGRVTKKPIKTSRFDKIGKLKVGDPLDPALLGETVVSCLSETRENVQHDHFELWRASPRTTLEVISEFLKASYSTKEIWYVGHSNIYGSWDLEDGELSIADFKNLLSSVGDLSSKTRLFVNSCYSHLWQTQFHGTFPPQPFYLVLQQQDGHIKSAQLVDSFFNEGAEQLLPGNILNFHVRGMSSNRAPNLHINGNLVREVTKTIRTLAKYENNPSAYRTSYYNTLKNIVRNYECCELVKFTRKASDIRFNPSGHKNDDSFKHGVVVFPACDGDCSLIKFDNEDQPFHILVDGGRCATFAEFAWPYLQQLPAIDMVVLTHHDADHINGLQDLFEAKSKQVDKKPSISTLWMARREYRPARTPDAADKLEKAATACGINVEDPARPYCSKTAKSVVVVSPSEELRNKFAKKFKSLQNKASICLIVSWSSHRLVMTGDANWKDVLEGLKELIPNENPIKLSYIDVPHHGSHLDSDVMFWKEVHSTVYVVTGDDKPRGESESHPTYTALNNIVVAYNEDKRKDKIYLLCTYETLSVSQLRSEIEKQGKSDAIIIRSLRSTVHTNNTAPSPALYYKIIMEPNQEVQVVMQKE